MTEQAAPIIVTAQMGAADQAWANDLRRRHFPPERNHLAAHITLFHHLPPSLEGEIRRLLARLTNAPKPAARISRAYSLGAGVALQVDSPALLSIRAEMARLFEHDLTPQDRHPPRLHITIQNKVTSQIARRTLGEMEALAWPRPLSIHGLACWHYRGGPWSPIAVHAFRR